MFSRLFRFPANFMYRSVCGSQEESSINGRRPRYVSVDFPSSPEAEYLSSASYIKQTFKLHSRTQSVTGGGAFFWAETGRPIQKNTSTKNMHCPTRKLIANQEHLFDTPTPPNAMRANEKTRHSNNDVFFVTFWRAARIAFLTHRRRQMRRRPMKRHVGHKRQRTT